MNRIVIDWRLPTGMAMQTIINDLSDQETERILQSFVTKGMIALEGESTSIDTLPEDQVAIVLVPMGRVDLIVVIASNETAYSTRKILINGMRGNRREDLTS